MANQYFGNIGDVWKHLVLGETLRIESPSRYWESHAGSAKYPLTASPGRDYGVLHFLERCSAETALRESTYNSVLERIAVSGNLKEYPGSPLIAMLVLDKVSARYLFVDIDADSCESIREAGRELQIDERRLVIAADDGVDVIGHAADQLRRNNPGGVRGSNSRRCPGSVGVRSSVR